MGVTPQPRPARAEQTNTGGIKERGAQPGKHGGGHTQGAPIRQAPSRNLLKVNAKNRVPKRGSVVMWPMESFFRISNLPLSTVMRKITMAAKTTQPRKQAHRPHRINVAAASLPRGMPVDPPRKQRGGCQTGQVVFHAGLRKIPTSNRTGKMGIAATKAESDRLPAKENKISLPHKGAPEHRESDGSRCVSRVSCKQGCKREIPRRRDKIRSQPAGRRSYASSSCARTSRSATLTPLRQRTGHSAQSAQRRSLTSFGRAAKLLRARGKSL